MSFSSTIAAVSTPRGKGGIAVIRISGTDAVKVASSMFMPVSGRKLGAEDDRKAVFGNILDSDGRICDSGIAVVFAGPRSFTGEDTVELSCHGGPAVTEAVLLSAIAHGSVMAGPGEFTRRAFVNGKMSLTEAEAVGLMIEADTRERLKLSTGGLRGNVSREIKDIASSMLDTMTALYAAIDYPEEDVGDEGEREIESTLGNALARINRLLDSYRIGRAVATGVKCVICGRPNVGKSSLFNLMVGDDCAIVTSVAGTTRDILRETVSFGGITLRLSDTAGIHGSDDTVEKIGISRAEDEVGNAEIVIAVFDGSVHLNEEDVSLIEKLKEVQAPVIAVINKSDEGFVLEGDEMLRIDEISRVTLRMSAGGEKKVTNELEKAVADIYGSGDVDLAEDAVIWDIRQREQLEHCRTALTGAVEGLARGDSLDCICTLAEEALASLDETDGRGVDEKIVGEVFSRFCVGK